MASSKLEPDALPEYNILLLGESGAGKTMFINSFICYIQHETLADAQKGPVSVSIPVKFNVTDDNNKKHEITAGNSDDNECLKTLAHSSTAKCRSYLVNFDEFRVRLIDSPGLGSTVIEDNDNRLQLDNYYESMQQDKKYVEEVLEFVSYFNHLHAIAIVVKSNETRYTTRFKQCLMQILTSFNKSAIDNLFFILTFGESTRFKTDIVVEPLKTLLEKVTPSNPEELLKENKVYSVDNKGFRYLLAVKKGASFEKDERKNSEKAWTKSRNECKRLIDYISGHGDQPEPKPHLITESLSINDARKLINIVDNLIENILTVIAQNKQSIDECLASSSKEEELIAEFENRLNERQQDVEINPVEIPHTVCKSSKCATAYNVDGKKKTHYSKICCEGCRVAIMMRLFCQAFELMSGNCKACGCHVGEHQRVYFTTKIVSKDIKDKDAIIKEMSSATDNKQKIEIAKKHAELQLKQLDNEKIVIENAQIIFKKFLKTNSIIPCHGDFGGDEVGILPDEVSAIKMQLLNLEVYGPAIRKAYGIAEKGEADDRQTIKLDSTKEKLISVKNTFSKWYRKQTESSEGRSRPSTAIVPVSLRDN